ncbi:MAG: MFS transporter [Clostridia bacterium]|nr:MFS transporter [Clostridia bacterium]
MRSIRKMHYGWIIVLAGALVMGTTHGVIANCFSLYLKPVTEELHLSRQGFSTCQMIVNLLYMTVSLVSGRIYRKVSPHLLMKIAALTLPASYFTYSLCANLPQFYGVSVAVGISVSFLTFLPFTQILTNWFDERRGLAIGICFMGSGLGGMLFNTLASRWITSMGWQGTYRTLAVIMLAVLVPMTYLVLKPSPDCIGKKPYGQKCKTENNARVYGPSVTEALKAPNFYLLTALALMIGMTTTMLGNTIIPHLSDLGYDGSTASGVMSAYLGGLAICKVLLGTMMDRLGARKATFFALLATGIGLAGLTFASWRPMHMLIIAGAALGCASCTVAYPLLARYALGTAAYASLYGMINAANSLTTSLAPVLTNAVYDYTGSYRGALIAGIVLCVISFFLLLPLKEEKTVVSGRKD